MCILILESFFPIVGPSHTSNSAHEFNETLLLGKVNSAPIKVNVIYSVAECMLRADLNYCLITGTPIPGITYSSCGCEVTNGESQMQYTGRFITFSVITNIYNNKFKDLP
jgi:hypothetical protein